MLHIRRVLDTLFVIKFLEIVIQLLGGIRIWQLTGNGNRKSEKYTTTTTKTKTHWKLDMYSGNMMCCFIYHFKDENGTKKYQFFIWFDDIQHADRVLKDDKNFLRKLALGNHTLRKVKLKVTSKDYKYSNKEMLQLGKLLAKYGYKVELY